MIADYAPMSLYQLTMLLLAGFAAAGGQFTITFAYFYAPAGEISIYDYTQILFATLWSLVIFSQVPDLFSILGLPDYLHRGSRQLSAGTAPDPP